MAENVVRLPTIRNALAIMARMQGAGYFLGDPGPGVRPGEGVDDLEAASDAGDDGLPVLEPDLEFWAAGEDDEAWIEVAFARAEMAGTNAAIERAVLRQEMAGDRVVALAAWRALRGG